MAGYGEDAGLQSWLSDSGHTLPEGAPALAVLRQRASDYIDTFYGPAFSGRPTDGAAQERAWPRIGATAWGQPIDAATVPAAVVAATYAAAYQEALAPGTLNAIVTPSATVKREKVGELEVEYFAGSGDALADATLRMGTVEGLLTPFLAKPVEGGAFIWAVGPTQGA